MNLKRCAISFALLTLVLGGLALPASAQSYKGTFTLPNETVWGPAVLEPGDYTVSTETVGATPFIRIEGNGKSATILAGATGYLEPFQAKGSLEVSEVNGTYVVTKLTAGMIGREYSFTVPRAIRKGNFPPVALKKAAIPASNTH
jgi:hypothetical protein